MATSAAIKVSDPKTKFEISSGDMDGQSELVRCDSILNNAGPGSCESLRWLVGMEIGSEMNQGFLRGFLYSMLHSLGTLF